MDFTHLRQNWLTLTFVYLLFLGAFGAMTSMVAWPVVAQLPLEVRSRSFPSVTGTVLESEVVAPDDSESDAYVRLLVEYTVRGQRYRTSRLNFGADISGTWLPDPGAVAEDYPQGARVLVYFDPRRPSTAALERGVRWDQISALVIIAPFLYVTLGLLFVPIALYRARNEPDTPLLVTQLGSETRYRIGRAHWVFVGAGGSLLGAFAAFCGGTCCMPMTSDDSSHALMVWMIQLGVTLGFVRKAIREDKNGYRDVKLDGSTRHFTFPPAKAFAKPTEVPLADIERFSLERSRTSESEDYDLVVHLRGGNTFLGGDAIPRRTADALLAALTAELTPRG